MIKYFISLLLMTNIAFAAPQIDVIRKGDPAPYDGLIMNAEQEQQFRLTEKKYNNAVEQIDSLTKLHKHYQENNQILMQRVENYQEHHQKLAKQVVDMKDSNFLENTLYFLGGAVLTGFIAYGVVNSLK